MKIKRSRFIIIAKDKAGHIESKSVESQILYEILRELKKLNKK